MKSAKNPRDWSGGSTAAWRKLRAEILRRDGHRCQIRLPGCTTVATEVDHIYGKVHGDDPTGLRAACSWCNKSRGTPSDDPSPRPRTQW